MNNYFGTLTPRMQQFREELLAAQPQVCVERALITTKVYQEHQDQPLVEVDDGFLDSHYSYYAYYGPLVRGMERIWESPYPIKEGPG